MSLKGDLIIPGSSYGDSRRQASSNPYSSSKQELIHGMTPNQMADLNDRMSKMMPRIASSNPIDQRRDLFSGELPKGANWDARRSAMSGAGLMQGGGFQQGGPRNLTTQMRPYQPEFESPDRQQYPVHRILANRYWRLFIKLDPVIGTGLEMYSEMPWSDCKLTGQGVTGEIRQLYENMWEETNIMGILPAMVREFLGIGEVCPHNFFDDKQGMWTYIALHNPDQLEVVDAPFIKMDPVVEFIPDDRLRAILTSTDPKLQAIREKMPPELIAKLYARQNIPLNTEVNATFIARKMHPYDTRGTSIIARMWRILMYEDAIFNASIATARRHAGPLKIAKLGNPQTNWIPGPEHERRFAELVAQAELDPHAWITFHYGLSLEAFGTTDRVMTINREWDVIERIKLVAMGLSRSFLTGEVTFASATAGLQIFLRRLLAMRNYFENVWIRPKFFTPVAEINDFVQRDQSELNHRVRIKRSGIELKKRLIIPKIDWANKLNPMVDKDLVAAYEQLEGMGIRISKGKKMAAVGLSFEDELKKGIEEDKFEKQVREEFGVSQEKGEPDEIKKVVDKTDETIKKDPPAEDKASPAPGGQPPPNPRNPQQQPSSEPSEAEPESKSADDETQIEQAPSIWDEEGRYHNWDIDNVQALVELLDTGETGSAFWSGLIPEQDSVNQVDNPYVLLQDGDPETAWNCIDEFLTSQGYPDNDINDLKEILVKEKVLPPSASFLAALDSLPDDAGMLSDAEFHALTAKALETPRPFVVAGKGVGPPKPLIKTDNFLVGEAADFEVKRRRSGGVPTTVQLVMGFGDIGGNKTVRRIAIKTPDFDPAANYASREGWQAALHRSKLPQKAKRYVKQLENEIVDGWDKAFNKAWTEIEKRLDSGQRVEPDSIRILVEDSVRKQLQNVDHEQVTNAFTGLYSEGKSKAYSLTNFHEKKLNKLRSKNGKQAFLKEAVTIDTHEDVRMLAEIKDTALAKVKSISNKDLRDQILKKLTEPGAENVNPIDLANEIVKEEAKKRKEETDYKDEASRAKLKESLKDLYDSQQHRLQLIMRTEAVNGFTVAQLNGYLEQGILKVKWLAHKDDPRTCVTCRALDGQEFEIEKMLSEGGRYPLSHYSHPACKCGLNPVIAYLTFDEFSKKYDETHPDQFVRGGPEFDDSKLDLSDVIIDSVNTPITTFEKVPVESRDELVKTTTKIDQSPYAKHAPPKAIFSQDVYKNDDYQLKAKPEKNYEGTVSSWHDPDTDTLHISSYASEFEPIGDVFSKAWSTSIWDKEPGIHKEWEKLFKRSPEQVKAPNLEKATVDLLQDSTQNLVQTYYQGNDECIGLTKKLRECSDKALTSILESVGVSEEDVETILTYRASAPIWTLDGESIQSEAEKNSYINTTAGKDAESFFRESLIAFMTKPWSLERLDPEVYKLISSEFFAGKEFKR